MPFEPVLNGWVQMMRAEGGGGERGKGKRREKKRKKEEKMGIKIKNRFFAQWSFFKYIRKTVSRLSRSYQLLFAIKILMVS